MIYRYSRWLVRVSFSALFMGACAASSSSAASPDEAPAEWALPVMVITASRSLRDAHLEPWAAYRLDARQGTLYRGKRTTANMLDGVPSVMIQRTGPAQTSPYIRGFTGYHTLALIDGIRLNHAAFRSGPNQYWNTLDPLSVGHYELVLGPGSVLYGSDAVGGVLNAMPLQPPAWDGAPVWERQLYYRGSSAEDSHVGRVQVGARLNEDLGFIGGISLKRFGDIQGGHDVGKQEKTGYDEMGIDGKINYALGDDALLTLAHQTLRQDDAWRTHRTIYGIDWKGLGRGTDKIHSYDQARDLTYLRLQVDAPATGMDRMEATLSRQAHGEDRYRVRANDETNRDGFDLVSWGGALQMESSSDYGNWVYGVDFYRDTVDSYSRRYAADGSLKKVDIQGPVADDASYDLAGVFVQNTISPNAGTFDIVTGLRYSYASADAHKVEDPSNGQQIALSDHWQAAAASVRILAPLDHERNHIVYTGISQGFRAPNLSDLTSLGIARSDEIAIPSPGLDAEKFITYEVGLKTRGEMFTAQLGVYFTSIDGMIVTTPTGRMRDGFSEVTKMNGGDGYIQGVEASLNYRITPAWSTWISGSWQEGKVDVYPSSLSTDKQREYISRLMPPTAQVGVRWQSPGGAYWAELIGDAAAKADKLSSGDQRDTQRIPPGGTPAYAVCTARVGTRIDPGLDLVLSAENLFDTDYRIHGSGVNEPGRNIILTAAYRF